MQPPQPLVFFAILVCLAGAPGGCGKDEPPPTATERGDTVIGALEAAKIDSARLRLAEVAETAYPLWAMNHPGTECPASLDELLAYVNRPAFVDPWDNPLILQCQDRPAGDDRFGVTSAGPDRKPGTEDDLHSWDEATRQLGRAGRPEPAPAQ